jgi:hypothetical protein
LAVATEERSVATYRVGGNRDTGLNRARIDLVNRYLAEAHGPPPRAPLRFWIGGEWVEIASPEPEPALETTGVQELRPVQQTRLPPSARENDTSQTTPKLGDLGQRDDHTLVRGKIASLRKQRDAGEITHGDFATRVAELLNGAVAPHVDSQSNPSS